MSKRILVAYASRTGTTARYAEAIGNTLRGNSLEVDVARMEDAKNLAAYDAYVIGSAIRSSKWLPEAAEFVRTNQAALRQKPVAMYTVAITMAMGKSDQYQTAVAGWAAPVRAMLMPVIDGFFPGRLDFSLLPVTWDTVMLRMAVIFGIFPKDDRTDLNAASAWAAGLPAKFGMEK